MINITLISNGNTIEMVSYQKNNVLYVWAINEVEKSCKKTNTQEAQSADFVSDIEVFWLGILLKVFPLSNLMFQWSKWSLKKTTVH